MILSLGLILGAGEAIRVAEGDEAAARPDDAPQVIEAHPADAAARAEGLRAVVDRIC